MSYSKTKCALLAFLVLISVLGIPSTRARALVEQRRASNAQRARLMEQIDHQRRLDHAKPEVAADQAGSVALGDETPAEMDYVVLVVLAASAVGFFVISKVRNRTRSLRRYPPYFPPR